MAKTKWQDDFPERAEEYARQGLDDKQIAHNLGISERTYYFYQERYPQFLQAIKRGKAPVDDEVENALLKRALGYEYEEVRTETLRAPDGKDFKVLKVTKITKLILPDVTAQIFWLKNRRPDQWRDKKQIDLPEGVKFTFNVSQDGNGKD